MPPRKKTADDVYHLLNEYIIKNEARFETLAKLDEKVNGNGKPGLIQEMTLVKERETKRDRREWFIFTIIAAEMLAILITNVL